MPILNIVLSQVGLVGVDPSITYIATNDTLAEVTTAGYLNKSVQQGYAFTESMMALVSTKTSPSAASTQVAWVEVSHSGSNWSLVPTGSPGSIVLPTVANQLVHATNATGNMSTDAANVVNLGNITAGSSAVAGSLTSFAGTGTTEFLRLAAINNTGGNFSTTISNIASVGQSQTVSIPDLGAATGNFIVSASAGTQTISTGSLLLTLGNITASAGNIAATLGSLLAGTTVTGGTGIIATTGNVTASAGNLVAGATAAAGTVTSFAGTGANEFLRLAAINNTTGDFSVTVSNAAAIGQSQVISIPDAGAATSNFILSAASTTQTLSTGLSFVGGGTNIQTTGGGNFLAGASGAAGYFISYPATAANGLLAFQAINNAGGDFDTTINNASSVGQDQVITIPNSGAATANFLLDTGAANILAQQEFVSINEVLTFGTGTWTTTRIAQGNYVKRHTPGDETSIIAVDITPMIRVAASKGFRLDSFDYIYAIAANALDAHSAVLDRIAYADNVAVSITSVPITASVATATQANPYVTNCTVTTPAFDITADSKYVLEITVNNAAASEYDYYGLMLRFSQTIA